MVGQITGLSAPLGLAIDVADNLYVGNQDSPTVPVYAPPYTGAPILTPNTTGYLPQGVAVSAKGVVAVMNFCNSSSCELYDVSFYARIRPRLASQWRFRAQTSPFTERLTALVICTWPDKTGRTILSVKSRAVAKRRTWSC